MRYLDPFAARPLVWSLFLLYLGATAWLAWLGWRKTRDLKSFATGGGTMSPLVVGITLAASMASTATFVINPGFIYKHGVAALIHLGVAVSLGIITGLIVLSAGFQRIGARTGALTLPHWIGQRYGSLRLGRIRGAFGAEPVLAAALVLLAIAITGAPPFSPFASELGVARAGLGGKPAAIAAAVALIASTVLVSFLSSTTSAEPE